MTTCMYEYHNTVDTIHSGNNNYWGLEWVLYNVGFLNLRINNVWGFKTHVLITNGVSTGGRTQVARVSTQVFYHLSYQGMDSP